MDYGVQCSETSPDGSAYVGRYAEYVVPVAIAAFLYSFGVPAIFMLLVSKFKKHGKGGDAVVRRALGWMYEPFRSGREWWLCAEVRAKMRASSSPCVGRSLLLHVV